MHGMPVKQLHDLHKEKQHKETGAHEILPEVRQEDAP